MSKFAAVSPLTGRNGFFETIKKASLAQLARARDL